MKIKQYFYVLRPILACMWIEERNAMPPIEFDVLVAELLATSDDLREEINKLLERKKVGDELDYEPKLRGIHDFIEEKIACFERIASQQTHMNNNQDNQLDVLFREALNEVWNLRKGRFFFVIH